MGTTANTALRTLLLAFLISAGMYILSGFLIPLVIGGVFAALFMPLCRWLERHRIPRGIASFLCMFSLLLAVAAIVALLGWQVRALTQDAAMIKQQVLKMVGHVQQFLFNHFGITTADQAKILSSQQAAATGLIGKLASSLASIFTDFVLILVYVLFLLYYRSHLRRFLLMLAPEDGRAGMNKVIDSVAAVSLQYLLGLFKMIVCLWVMYGIGFSVAGIDNALFFAFLCGLLEIVPFIGNITGTSITLLVAAAQGDSTGALLAIAATYGLIQFIQGWFLEPLIVGAQVRINALSTIIALILGELIWGIPGIFLAIPMVAMFKIVCDNVESLKPIGFLIGESAPAKERKVQ